jgi:hypothetical protein
MRNNVSHNAADIPLTGQKSTSSPSHFERTILHFEQEPASVFSSSLLLFERCETR